jgi:xanthine dehydrogenase small subunit
MAPASYASGRSRWVAPDTYEALWDALDEHADARIVNGGTDLAIEVTRLHTMLPTVVSVEALPGLRDVVRIDGGWRYGAGVLLSDLEGLARDTFPPLARMLRFFASRQIKNRATLGGNVCNASPIGDTPPVLLALEAIAVIRGRGGERRVPMDAFFLSYRRTALQRGEILVAIEIPDLPDDARAAAYKVSKRRELDISAVCAAMAVRVAGDRVAHVRVAYGGLAPTPARAVAVESALLAGPWNEAAVVAAADLLERDFRPIDDHRGSAWYRATVARNLLRGFFLETSHEPVPRLPERPAATVLPEVGP